jgi:hypothetical protein
MLKLPKIVGRAKTTANGSTPKTLRVLRGISPPQPPDLTQNTRSGSLGIDANAVKGGMTLKELHANPSVSQWLKDALMTAYDRDPVDAIRDAQSLLKLLGERYTQIVTRSPGTVGQ